MEIKGLRNRVAIVTAAGQNIGKAIALALAEAGAHVIINGGKNAEKIDAVAAEARKFGVETRAVLADATDPAAVQKMVDGVVNEFGRLDIAVSCVGIRPHQAFEEISIEAWQNVINTNLGSCFLLSRSAVPHMRKQKFGRLVYIAGTDALFPLANRAHVVAAKHGIHGLAKAIALECGPDGITANSIAPGWLYTERNPDWYPDLQQTHQHLKETLPLRDLGDTSDVSNACLYLTSDMGKFVTGHLLHVNGGEFMV